MNEFDPVHADFEVNEKLPVVSICFKGGMSSTDWAEYIFHRNRVVDYEDFVEYKRTVILLFLAEAGKLS